MKEKFKYPILIGILSLTLLGGTTVSNSLPTKVEATPAKYEFSIETSWLTMKDGVRLSVTFFKPAPRKSGEKFPVLFEFLPYRKEDSFYLRDYPLYTYFVRHGFIMAKVDIRGSPSTPRILRAGIGRCRGDHRSTL